MPSNKPTSPIKSSTQSFIEVEEIKDDIVLMRDGSATTVIEVGAVNFWLLSQDEQTSIIYSYANFLNSLSFPVQILILSKRMDISMYLEYLNDKAIKQRDEKIKTRLTNYAGFIKDVVKKNTVMEKRFFFAIPFSPLELGLSNINLNKNKEYIISRAKTSLYPKRDHLIRLISKIGLRTTTMQKQELTELFFNLYNPSSSGRRLAPVETYTDVVLTNG
jgi:hypothetical protein